MRKFLFLIVICLCGVNTLLWAAFASIDKVKIRVDSPTGSTVAGVITVGNNEDKPINVKIYPMEWTYVSPFDGSKKFMPIGSSCPGSNEWVQIYPGYVRLEPGERRSVHYKLNIPPGLKKPCYLVIFFETDVTGSSSVSGKTRIGLQVFTRIGCLILVEPSNIAIRSVGVDSVNMVSPNKLQIRLNNLGNTVLIGNVSIFVMNEDGKIISRTEKKDVYMPPGETGSIPLKLMGSGLMVRPAYEALVTIQPEMGHPVSVELPIISDK